MKRLLFALALLVWISGNAQNPDCLIDSVRIVSPYWGLHFETGTVQDTLLNCGSSNTNFVPGTTYRLLKFPFGIANMGNGIAYLGRFGVNGVTHDRCWDSPNTNPTDFINIPNFNRFYLLDSCGNVIASNSKTDFNIQNSAYAMGIGSIDHPNQVVFYSQYFPGVSTVGSQPNILKDWLESKCGPIDTNMAYLGRNAMDEYYRNCQVCDSIILFPNYASWDDAVLQLPSGVGPGKYYLSVACSFYMLNQSVNCHSDSLVLPFQWDGSFGISQTFPYPANGVTYLAQGFGTCVQVSLPQAPVAVAASTNGSQTTVTWVSNDPGAAQFTVTPYVMVGGNAERPVSSLIRSFASSPAVYTNQELRNASEVLQYFSGGRNNVRFRFRVKAVNSAGSSAEVSSGNPAVQIR